MNNIIYVPFISKENDFEIPEASVFQPIPISIPINSPSGVELNEEVVKTHPEHPKRISYTELPETLQPIKINHGSNSSANKSAWSEVWEQFGSKFGLKDETAYLHLLGQLIHESGNFRHMEEIASGNAYEGRADLGNTEKGDGKRFKGRGPIQVTGRNNYKQIYENFFVPNGLGEYNIVENPELGSDPKIGSLMTIGWFLTTDGGKRAIEAFNRHDIESATKAINGGLNGFSNRANIIKGLMKRTNQV